MNSAPTPEPQSAGAVLMVRPACFTYNSETAASNAFQCAAPAGIASGSAQEHALREFDALAGALDRGGVKVVLAADPPAPVKPDAVFPNNWVSFHQDGTVVLYPMLAANRRAERREEVVRRVVSEGGFRTSRTVDLTYRELDGKYLEGTGSLVLDRTHRVAYASLSPRTDLDVLGEFAQILDYHLVTFESCDPHGTPVYHTNVVLAVGSRFALLCEMAIPDPGHRAAVAEKLRATGHEIIAISLLQMQRFAANVLELKSASGPLIALSATAWQSLDAAQRRLLEGHGAIVTANVAVIESIGGGSVRCMLADIHLPTPGVS